MTTPRLVGRRLAPHDLDALCAMHADPAVMATLGGTRSDEITRAYLREHLAHERDIVHHDAPHVLYRLAREARA